MVTSKHRSEIETALFETSHHALDYLRLLYVGYPDATLSTISAEVGVTVKTISTAIKDLDRRYVELSGGALVHRRGRTYELTAAGKRIARSAALGHDQLIEAVASSFSAHSEAWLQVANDCWAEFERLAKALRPSIILRPRSTRSADLSLHEPATQPPGHLAANYALYSACLESADLRTGDLVAALPGDHNTSVVVTRVSPFAVLVRDGMFGPRPSVSAEQLRTTNYELVVPAGGAVWRYLDLLDAGWDRRRRPIRATDLEACLGVVRHGGLLNPVMIVHGLPQSKIPTGFTTYSIENGPAAAAVGGFFRRETPRLDWAKADRELWNSVWAEAQKLWHTNISAQVMG